MRVNKNNKSFFFIIGTCFLIIFSQAIFLPINFLLLLVLFLSLVSESNSFFWAFLLGLGFDLLASRQIGLSSLALLAIAFLIFLYKRKVATFHLLFLTFFSFFAACIFDLITLGFIKVSNSLILMAISFILGVIIQYFGFLKWQGKEQLSL